MDQLSSHLGNELKPDNHEEGQSHARILIRAIDLIFGNSTLRNGIVDVLRLCQAATQADLWMLVRHEAGGAMTLASGPKSLGGLEWQECGDHFSWAQLDRHTFSTYRPDLLPDELRAFRSIVSVPLEISGEAPMAMLLLSEHEAAFKNSDQELLYGIGQLVKNVANSRFRDHRDPVLAGVPDVGPAEPIEDQTLLETSLEDLSHACVQLADWQGAIVKITNDLLCADVSDAEAAINHALARTGALVGCDRTYVFRLRDPDHIYNTHEWTAPGIEPMIAKLQGIPASLMNEWRSEMAVGRAIHIPNVSALPQTSAVREILAMQAIRSLLAVPMVRDDHIVGFVGFDAVRMYRKFSALEIQLLHTLANAISILIDRSEVESAAETEQAELEAQRNRLDSTLAAIPDLVLELDDQGRFSGHVAGVGLRELPPKNLLGRMPEEVLPPELASITRRVLRIVDRDGQVSGVEYEHTVGGKLHWFSLSAAGRMEQGLPCGYVFVIRDITEMKLLYQQQLHDRAVALDASGDGIAITDPEGNYTYMNAAYRCMFGISDDADVSCIDGRDLLSPDTVSAFMKEHWDNLAACGTWRGEIDGLDRNGNIVPQEVSLTLRDSGMLCIARDISDRRRMQRALHDRAVALDASDDGIAITDRNGHYAYMNSAHRRMFGIRDDEDISSMHWHEIYPEETVKRFMAKEWQILQATGRWRGKLHGVHRDGSLVSQEVSLTLHDDGILCLTRDISEQLREAAERASLREELQGAQRRETIAQLASGVAHDLNNLVAVVAGSIPLIQQKVAGDKDATASVERIKRAAEIARDLVGGLGQLGRPQAERTTHDLRTLITEGVELLGNGRLQDHTLYISLPDTPCLVWANGTELLQVIVNLVLNACEAAAEQTNLVSVSISPECALPDRTPDAGSLRSDIAYVIFTVSDRGVGIDTEIREQIFDRYFTTKTKTGTGLGLPIVSGILRDNSAALWVDSILDIGTTVTVAWPMREPPCTAATNNSPRQSSGVLDLNGHNVLVVDDLADVADVLSEFLEAYGANTISVTDPKQAAALLHENPGIWGALVTDLNMPVVNGTELARIAGACEPAVPVVLITAVPEGVGCEKSLFFDVLSKPVQPAHLVDAVKAAIRQKAEN